VTDIALSATQHAQAGWRGSDTEGMATAKPALHLTASMRVVASHLHMRRVSVDIARDTVQEAAQRVAAGSITPEIESLRARLEKATGCPIAELAQHSTACRTR
jgi:hypothetical protein